MKKLLSLALLGLLFMSSNKTSAQSLWFEEGTTWVHLASTGFGGGYYETKLQKDTIIGGIACKKFIRHSKIYDFGTLELLATNQHDPIFMYASLDDNEVFYYEDGAFKKIYDFEAPVGSLLELPFNENIGSTMCPNNNFMIDSKGTEIIDGENLKWIELVSTSDTQHGYGGRVYQKMGSTSWYFTTLADINGCVGVVEDFNYVTEFRCFRDDGFEYKDPFIISDYNGNCYFPGNEPLSVVDFNELDIKMFPNPVQNVLTIENNKGLQDRIEIISLLGKVEKVFDLKFNTHNIDLSSLSSGVYFLRFVEANHTMKIIKK